MTTTHTTFTEFAPVAPGAVDNGASMSLEDVVERLRGVRLKVGRWLPNSEALAAWSADYSEVYKAATRLDSAVQELDSHIARKPNECSEISTRSLTLQMLLCSVEERATEFEETVIENLASGN